MARRVSWTNNSSGHLGTYVYRAPTLDPQNLPAPAATVDPVEQGETAEWVDNSGDSGCFAVQDFDGNGVGALSAEVCVSDPWTGIQIGDTVAGEGGIYAGKITYQDSRQFHLIYGRAGATRELTYGYDGTLIGSNDHDDGVANLDTMIATGNPGPAFDHCIAYTADGHSDFYLPAINELQLIRDNLQPLGQIYVPSDDHWSSTEVDAFVAREIRMDNNSGGTSRKFSPKTVVPVRRVPA